MSLLLIGVGVVILYLGGELLVASSSQLARVLGLAPLVIGLTVVAFATSSPELFATLIAVLQGSPALSVGNVLGSNIANLALILGVAALIRPLAGRARFLKREIPVLIIAGLAPFVVLADGEIERWEGSVLLALLVGYVWYLLSNGEPPEVIEEYRRSFSGPTRPWWVATAGIVFGLLLLTGGAKVLVTGAVDLARELGVGERVIGLTLVAFGTSLPELASSIAAARRREGDIVLGNIVGSNIFNVFCVLGLTTLVRPIDVVGEPVLLDMAVGLALSVAMVPILLVGRRLYLGRGEGLLLVTSYVVYIAFLFV